MDIFNSFPESGIPCSECKLLSSCHLIKTEEFTQYSCARCLTELCSVKSQTQLLVSADSVDDFEYLRINKFLYVDKTLMIKEVCRNGAHTLALIRPSKFGKSLNLSMLLSFFSVLKQEKFDELFEGTRILQEKEIIEDHANKYPVIHLDLSSFSESSCNSKKDLLQYLQGFLLRIKREYSPYLTNIHEWDKEALNRFEDIENDAAIIEGLKTLSRVLHRVFGRKCIILIDEYDAPLNKTFDSKEKFEILKMYYYPFLVNSLEINQYAYKGIVTGCTRVYCGLDYLSICSFLESDFQTAFGFSEEEVEKLLKGSGKVSKEEIEQKMRDIKDYYGEYQVIGFHGALGIYNPVSIIKYLETGELKNYWRETRENRFIQNSLNSFPNVIFEIIEILKQDVFEREIDKHSSIFGIQFFSGKIWTLLFFAGYLTKNLDGTSPQEGYLRLQIPNKEILEALARISKRLELLFDKGFQDQIRQALSNSDIENLIKEINGWIREPGADVSEKAYAYEDDYRNTVKGLLKFIAGQEWDIIEWKIQGGRNDLIVVPKRVTGMKKAYIFQFKFLSKGEDVEISIQEEENRKFNEILKKQYWRYFQDEKEKYDVKEVLEVRLIGRDSKLNPCVN